MARRNASSVQRPIPVLRSGVRLAEKTAPNGVSIRFPPANGFAGSAVWQLPQSPASVSALPLAMVSGDGGAGSWARAALDAVHKRAAIRIAAALCCQWRVEGYPMAVSITRN